MKSDSLVDFRGSDISDDAARGLDILTVGRQVGDFAD